ncbi:MAG TPA: hypothetical protein PK906_04905 [Spirochaetota bacterium]|nr:hypothetical protein [Spirochaetota bacterium]
MTGDGAAVKKTLNRDIDTLFAMLSGLFSKEDDFVLDPGKQRAGLEMIVSG